MKLTAYNTVPNREPISNSCLSSKSLGSNTLNIYCRVCLDIECEINVNFCKEKNL